MSCKNPLKGGLYPFFLFDCILPSIFPPPTATFKILIVFFPSPFSCLYPYPAAITTLLSMSMVLFPFCSTPPPCIIFSPPLRKSPKWTACMYPVFSSAFLRHIHSLSASLPIFSFSNTCMNNKKSNIQALAG